MSIFSQAIQASLSTDPRALIEGSVTNSLSSGMKYGSDPALTVKTNVVNVSQISSTTANKLGPNFDRFSILRLPSEYGVNGNFFESAIDFLPISTVTATLGSNFLTDELNQVNPALLLTHPKAEITKLANNVYKSVSNEAEQAGKAAVRGVIQTAKDFARGAVNTVLLGAQAGSQNVGVTDSRIAYAFSGPKEANSNYLKGQAKGGSPEKLVGVEPIMNPNYVFRLQTIATKDGGDDSTTQEKSLLDKEMTQGVSTLGNREVTLTNLLKLGDFSKDNQTPYRAADFLWLKHYNKIPLNRLVTLRRYMFPIDDNRQRSPYFDAKEKNRGWSNNPVSQMVTYFGGESGNNLSSILSIQTSTTWSTDSSQLQYVNLFNGLPTDTVTVLKKYAESSALGKTAGTLASALFPVANKLKIPDSAEVLGGASLMAMGIIDSERYSGLGSFRDVYNPYTRGGYLSDLYQQPYNVVKETKKREPGLLGGINSFTLDFEYSLKSIGQINAKAAMLDIMANVLATTHYRGNFWGGEARFFLNKGIFPLLDSDQTIKLVSAIWRGDYKNGGTIILNMFKQAFGSTVNSLEDVVKILNAMASASKNKTAEQDKELKDFVVGAGGAVTNQSEMASKASGLTFSSIATNDVLAKLFGIDSSGGGPPLPTFQALKTGAPVGEWHLTVGNPFKPIAKIGNLICNRVTIKFNDELGSDDFPTEMKVTVSLEPGMARANQDIESIFNHGGGALYLPKPSTEKDGIDDMIETVSREAALSGVADFAGILPNSVAQQFSTRLEGNQTIIGVNQGISPHIEKSTVNMNKKGTSDTGTTNSTQTNPR